MHKRSIRFVPCQVERRRRQHRARELEELIPSYRKLATFEKFMGELSIDANDKGCPVMYPDEVLLQSHHLVEQGERLMSLLNLQGPQLYASTCVLWWDQHLTGRTLQSMQQPFTCPSYESKRTSGMSLPLYINRSTESSTTCLHQLQLYICFPTGVCACMRRHAMIYLSMPGVTVRVQQPSNACYSGRGRNLPSWPHASADGSHSCAEGVPRYDLFPFAKARACLSSLGVFMRLRIGNMLPMSSEPAGGALPCVPAT